MNFLDGLDVFNIIGSDDSISVSVDLFDSGGLDNSGLFLFGNLLGGSNCNYLLGNFVVNDSHLEGFSLADYFHIVDGVAGGGFSGDFVYFVNNHLCVAYLFDDVLNFFGLVLNFLQGDLGDLDDADHILDGFLFGF